MLDYNEMVLFAKNIDLLKNRVGIINEILGLPYHHASTNPVRLFLRRGRYVFEVCGSEVACFGSYDADGVSAALSYAESVSDALWHLRRGGFV